MSYKIVTVNPLILIPSYEKNRRYVPQKPRKVSEEEKAKAKRMAKNYSSFLSNLYKEG